MLIVCRISSGLRNNCRDEVACSLNSCYPAPVRFQAKIAVVEDYGNVERRRSRARTSFQIWLQMKIYSGAYCTMVRREENGIRVVGRQPAVPRVVLW